MANAEMETEMPQEATATLAKVASTVALETTSENPISATEMSPQLNKSTQNGRYLRTQFEQKTKLIQEFWSQQHQQIVKLNKDHSQLIIIMIMSTIGILCSLVAVSSNNWTCDKDKHICFGLWNTCYISEQAFNNSFIEQNDSMIVMPKIRVLCAQQGLHDVKIEYALQSRIDQVNTSQGLIVSGCVLYAFSILTIFLAYRYINMNNLNSVRNALVTSICVQILAFLTMLIGFFLFILTERLSLSVILLFVYFGLVVLVSNLINFMTIEYKTFKSRQMSI